MEEITEPQMNYIGKRLAYYSAIFGTLIMVTYLISNSFFLLVVGAVYILGAALINTLVLLLILIELISNQKLWRSSVATIICMLLNIPLSIFYIFLLTYFNF